MYTLPVYLLSAEGTCVFQLNIASCSHLLCMCVCVRVCVQFAKWVTFSIERIHFVYVYCIYFSILIRDIQASYFYCVNIRLLTWNLSKGIFSKIYLCAHFLKYMYIPKYRVQFYCRGCTTFLFQRATFPNCPLTVGRSRTIFIGLSAAKVK
jgi:hypothetical protein